MSDVLGKANNSLKPDNASSLLHSNVWAHMPPWNLSETREHISRLFGRRQLELAAPSIRSVDDRQIYAGIHFRAARTVVEAYVSAELQNVSLLEVISDEDEGWIKFNVFIREVGAHLTACIQSIHAVPDILANALYYSLGLNLLPGAIKPRALSVTSVAARLMLSPESANLAALLETLAIGGEFKHLSALSNQAKHRTIVFPSLNEDSAGERAARHVVTFPAFEHESVLYGQVFADKFLRNESSRCSALVVAIGGELNAILSTREK
jgi:hypothetical protein